VRQDLEVAVPSGPIRVAIVGTGGIARVHAAALGPSAVPGPAAKATAVLAAAADINAGRLADFAREYRVPAAYRELEDLLSEARPDLVHICTPPHAHHQQALTCLKAGVSVLVEKPPVISLLSPREESYLRFDFEQASVEVTHLYGYTDRDLRITLAPGRKWAGRAPDQLVPPGPGQPSGHRGQFDEVLACLAAGRRPPVAPDDSRRTLSLVAAIYAAAFTGQPVTPADLVPGSPFYGRMDGGPAPW
jgi:predicted dehydrogenase